MARGVKMNDWLLTFDDHLHDPGPTMLRGVHDCAHPAADVTFVQLMFTLKQHCPEGALPLPSALISQGWSEAGMGHGWAVMSPMCRVIASGVGASLPRVSVRIMCAAVRTFLAARGRLVR